MSPLPDTAASSSAAPTGGLAGSSAGGSGGAVRTADPKGMAVEDMQANAAKAARLLKAIGNERRLLILCHLSQGERSVGELERLIGLSQSALSQHLGRLRADNLVTTRRQAQTIFYSLAGRKVPVIMQALYNLYCASADTGSEATGHG